MVDAEAMMASVQDTLERTTETISLIQKTIIQIRTISTKGSGDANGESTTVTSRKVAQQEVGINVQTGEDLIVCLFPFSYNLVL